MPIARASFVMLIAFGLSGCATLLSPTDSACRHVLAPSGQALRFCEMDNLITVDDHPPPAIEPDTARVIDDPVFLKGMFTQLPSHSKPPAKRVQPSPPGYITIAESDFVALVQEASRKGTLQTYPVLQLPIR